MSSTQNNFILHCSTLSCYALLNIEGTTFYLKLIKYLTLIILIFSLAIGSVAANELQTKNIEVTSQQSAKADKFTDIPKGHWAETAINSAVKKGYVSGYPDGTFKPDKSVTRAEFVKMAVEALGIKTTSTVTSPWYTPYTEAAKKAGILKDDYTATQFNNSLPRNEMAKIAVLGADVRAWTRIDRGYGDVSFAAENLAEYMFLATQNGLVQGIGNGKVGADGTTTRAQAITIIERIVDLKNGKKLTPADTLTQSNAEFEWHRSNILTKMGKHIDQVTLNFGKNGYLLENDAKTYKGELLKLTVIDLADKNDPNRSLVKNIDELVWSYDWTEFEEKFPIKNFTDSYLLVYDLKLHYNKLSAHTIIPLDHTGLSPVDFDAQLKGKLSGISDVYDMKNLSDTRRYFIIPKSVFKTHDSMGISLHFSGIAEFQNEIFKAAFKK